MEETQKAKGKRGFASMDPEKVKEIARMGGKAISEQRGSAGMAEIGRKGGNEVSKDRLHMSKIGRIGGMASSSKKTD